MSLTTVDMRLDKYDYLAIANELIDTALGKAYYGNALYIAKQFSFLDDADQRVLDRWLAGTQGDHAHIDLVSVANKIKVLGAIPMTRSQATPISSQMMTMERMLSERDDHLAELHKLNSELTDKANSYIVANAKLDAELAACQQDRDDHLRSWNRVVREKEELVVAMQYLRQHKLWANSHAKAVIESALAKVGADKKGEGS